MFKVECLGTKIKYSKSDSKVQDTARVKPRPGPRVGKQWTAAGVGSPPSRGTPPPLIFSLRIKYILNDLDGRITLDWNYIHAC